MVSKNIRKKMRFNGIELLCGKLSRDVAISMLEYFPVAGIWHESDDPTAKEIDAVAAYLRSIAYLKTDGLTRLRQNSDTIILLKQDGQWFVRRSSWPTNPMWKPLASLKELRALTP